MKFVLLRIGRIVWTNELVARKKIDDRYKDRCVLCLEYVRESTKHFVLECVYLRSVRDEFRSQMNKLRDLSSSANELLGYILGNRVNVLIAQGEKDILVSVVIRGKHIYLDRFLIYVYKLIYRLIYEIKVLL
ncbi:hypothetical protein NGRA_3446, partial [Nosema granulosis]